MPTKSVLASLLVLWCIAFPSLVTANEISIGSKLEVSVTSLHVRDSTPWFGWRTLFTFRYSVNPPIDILERGAIVEAKDVKYVGNDQRWVNIKYDKEGQTAEGWIYTGQKPTISNVEVLDSSATISMTKPAVLGNPNTTKSAITISLSLFPKAFAESDDSSDEVTPPNPPTIQVLVFQLVHVLVFIISFAIFYRLTKDKWLTTFGSSSVLLIFGFLSQSAFLELFNKIS